jgi:WD40 repeat protein
LLLHSLTPADESAGSDSEYGVTAFDWSPDGYWLAVTLSNGESGYIQIWDVKSLAKGGDPRLQSTFNNIVGYALHWSPDSAHLALGTASTVLILDPSTGETIRSFDGHEDFVLDLDWSPDGTRLASASYDNTMRIWDVFSGTELGKYDSEGFVTAVSWSPVDEKVVFTGQAATIEQPFQTVDAPPALALDEAE